MYSSSSSSESSDRWGDWCCCSCCWDWDCVSTSEMGRLGNKPIFPVNLSVSTHTDSFGAEEWGLGISSEPGSMVFDCGRPAFVAAVGGSSVAVFGAGTPGCEGGGSAGSTHPFNQFTNTHRPTNATAVYCALTLYALVRVKSGRVVRLLRVSV